MIQAKCIEKFRDKTGKIYGYKLIDIDGKTIEISTKNLKDAIEKNQINVINLKLSSDKKLIDDKDGLDTFNTHNKMEKVLKEKGLRIQGIKLDYKREYETVYRHYIIKAKALNPEFNVVELYKKSIEFTDSCSDNIKRMNATLAVKLSNGTNELLVNFEDLKRLCHKVDNIDVYIKVTSSVHTSGNFIPWSIYKIKFSDNISIKPYTDDIKEKIIKSKRKYKEDIKIAKKAAKAKDKADKDRAKAEANIIIKEKIKQLKRAMKNFNESNHSNINSKPLFENTEFIYYGYNDEKYVTYEPYYMFGDIAKDIWGINSKLLHVNRVVWVVEDFINIHVQYNGKDMLTVEYSQCYHDIESMLEDSIRLLHNIIYQLDDLEYIMKLLQKNKYELYLTVFRDCDGFNGANLHINGRYYTELKSYDDLRSDKLNLNLENLLLKYIACNDINLEVD